MNKIDRSQAFVELDFPKQEYDDRYVRARQMMRERNLDALIITNVANYIYFSGHTATHNAPHWMWTSHARPFVMIFPAKGNPMLIAHILEQLPAGRSSPWCEVRTYSDLPFKSSLLADVIREMGLKNARIGAELGLEQRFQLPFDDLRAVQSELPSVEFVDASGIFLDLRFIKSPLEIERLRKSCSIAEEAFRTVVPDLRIGMTEREVVKRVSIRMLELGADRPTHFLLSRVAPYHQLNRPADRTLEKGDTWRMDFGAVYQEYQSDMSWTMVFGEPTPKQVELFGHVARVIKDLEAMIRPGIQICEITKRYNELLEKDGLPPKGAGRIGHGIGLNFNERPSIDLIDTTVLKESMCLALEPGIFTPEGGFVIEDNFVIRSEGIELLHPDNLKQLYVVPK